VQPVGGVGETVSGVLRPGQGSVEETQGAEVGEGRGDGEREAVEPAPFEGDEAEERDGDPGRNGDEEGDDDGVDAVRQPPSAQVVEVADSEDDEGGDDT
jgi:hypothetical protein